MPIDIATDTAAAPIAFDELVDWLMTNPPDPRNEASLVPAGVMLARLGADCRMLGDLAIRLLTDGDGRQDGRNRYGAQVLLLHPGGPGWFLRANIWPAADDPVVRTSGIAPFFYGVAHDHNFSFLTTGHHGPGYWSDYWEHDYTAVDGLPGERVQLTPLGRSRLSPGRTMLYRAHRDVHRQLPPDALSVSINIMFTDPGLPWRDQYRFDPEAGVIDGLLGSSATETLVTLSALLGGGEGRGLATDMARRHPSARLRASALRALADAAETDSERAALFEQGAADAAAQVSDPCRTALDDLVRNGCC